MTNSKSSGRSDFPKPDVPDQAERQIKSEGFYDITRESCNPGKQSSSLPASRKDIFSDQGGNGSQERRPGGLRNSRPAP